MKSQALPIQKEAARQFAFQPEGFDPNRRDPLIYGNVSQKVKEQLELTRKLAEEQWVEEHKFQPPKALDVDELAFLEQRAEAQRLRNLERELADMTEVEKFHAEVSKKVFSAVEVAPIVPPVKPGTPAEATKKKKPAVMVKIVPQKKRKAGEEEEDEHKQEQNKKQESLEISSKKSKKEDNVDKAQSAQPKEKDKDNTKQEAEEEEPPLVGLVDYGDSD